MPELYLRTDFAGAELPAIGHPRDLLAWAERIAASAPAQAIYRRREGRLTLRFYLGERGYFLKLHRGVGWREIGKNLLQGKLPVLGAGREYRAIRRLRERGLDTLSVAAYAGAGRNPATRHSLLVTDELAGTVSLETYCADWASAPPALPVRLRLVRALAGIARRMHEAGVQHRDFYLCHLHLDPQTLLTPSPRCYLIDLHRASVRRRLPRRCLVKDLGGLYFSAMEAGLTQRDLLRFLRHYARGGLRQALVADARFWRRVARRARRLQQKHKGSGLPVVRGKQG